MDAVLETLIHYIKEFTYLGVFLGLLSTSVLMPVPQNLTLICCGFLAEKGYVNPFMIVFVCCLALMGTDNLIYTWGKWYGGENARISAVRKFLNPKRRAKFHQLFHKFGSKVILIVRLTPGLRMLVLLSAGATHMPRSRFALLDGIGIFINVPLLVGLGYVFSYNLELLKQNINRVETLIVLLVLVIFLAYLVWTQWMLGWVSGEDEEEDVSKDD